MHRSTTRSAPRLSALATALLLSGCTTMSSEDVTESYDLGGLGRFSELRAAEAKVLPGDAELLVLVEPVEIALCDAAAGVLAAGSGSADAVVEGMRADFPERMRGALANLRGVSLPPEAVSGSVVMKAQGRITAVEHERSERKGGAHLEKINGSGGFDLGRLRITARVQVRVLDGDRILASGTADVTRTVPLNERMYAEIGVNDAELSRMSDVVSAAGSSSSEPGAWFEQETNRELSAHHLSGLLENAFVAAAFDAVHRMRVAERDVAERS